MRFSSLGSGSAGNALLFEVGRTRLMLDCGLGLAECCQRLADKGWQADQLDAILVTHEHGDHIGGVARLARKFNVPVYASAGTLVFLEDRLPPGLLQEVAGELPFALGDTWIEPYSVPHDARQPLQFVLGDGVRRLGVLTDVGRSTPHIEAMLSACDALVLECNPDAGLLQQGPYPASLKRRVAGPFGHLDNQAAAVLLASLDVTRLQHVVAAHLSLQNNRPELAQSALAGVLGCASDWIGVATQSAGFDWRSVA